MISYSNIFVGNNAPLMETNFLTCAAGSPVGLVCIFELGWQLICVAQIRFRQGCWLIMILVTDLNYSGRTAPYSKRVP